MNIIDLAHCINIVLQKVIYDITARKSESNTNEQETLNDSIELYQEMMKDNPADMKTSVHVSALSHLIGYAAEESRLSGETVSIEKYRQSLQ